MAPKPQDACALPRKKNMSRPRISEPRSEQLNLSLTASELAGIKRRAEAVGMRPVHFSRSLILGDQRKPTKNDDAVNHISRLIYGQLARLGNNLNQMVRHLHRTGDPLPPDLEPLLKDIRQILAKVRQ